MGCDIHVFTETLKSVNSKQVWCNVDNWRFNPYYVRGNKDGERQLDVSSIYRSRDYELFGVLADVRSDEGMLPIIKPKGKPTNMSKPTKDEVKRWDGDGHSHSYFTLQELIAARPKYLKVKRSGLVSTAAAKRLDEGTDTPKSWCGWASPELQLEFREWEEERDVLKSIITKLTARLKEIYYISEDEEYDDELNDKIRIVFFFDN